MKFDVFEYTSRGGRDYNEDCLGCWYNAHGGIFVVADGLGGHKFGDKASLKAVETIIRGWDIFTEDILAQLNDKIIEANRNILALQSEMKAVMKTTAAVLAVSGTKAFWANSGDSRVYFIHDGELYAVTNDHSVAFKKFKAGEITREQIGCDEDQSRLLRTLGSEERYEPELYSADINIGLGDAFLLCSDGAWEYLKDEEIVVDYLKSANAEQWSELMLLRIMERLNGENDNLSLITIIIE